MPQAANQRSAINLISDALMDGRRFRILCVINDFPRAYLATLVDNSIFGARVAREPEGIAERHSHYPLMMVVCKNGT